jgi:hypothetical protein
LKHQVKALLIGVQDCIFYGAAEFSRDVDYAVLIDPENLLKMKAALVQSKKTRCDKDGPMIRRLVDADYTKASEDPPDKQIRFGLQECRTPERLILLLKRFPNQADAVSIFRPLLSQAYPGNEEILRDLLKKEEDRERDLDRAYWVPLRKELERWRR